MSRQSDLQTAINNSECGVCKHSCMVGNNFFCNKDSTFKQISALAKEDCYELDPEIKERLNGLTNDKN